MQIKRLFGICLWLLTYVLDAVSIVCFSYANVHFTYVLRNTHTNTRDRINLYNLIVFLVSEQAIFHLSFKF